MLPITELGPVSRGTILKDEKKSEKSTSSEGTSGTLITSRFFEYSIFSTCLPLQEYKIPKLKIRIELTMLIISVFFLFIL
jgi:hypothetical protein